MAIGFIMEFTGVGHEAYDAVNAEAGVTSTMPTGGLAHFAGPTANGWRVVDLWESQEAFDTFFQTRLGPALQKVGVPAPEVTVMSDVYKYLV